MAEIQIALDIDNEQMAKVLGRSKAEVEAELESLKAENILLGWRPVLHPEASRDKTVRALIEVKITPEREGGFDRLAERIAREGAVPVEMRPVLRTRRIKR